MQSFVMPAEWETQRAVWFSWPHNIETWPVDVLPSAEPHYAYFIAQLSAFQQVCINIDFEKLKTRVESCLKAQNANFKNIQLFDHPTNDSWCRDHGPIFVKDQLGNKTITNWGYNAWGGKYPPFDLDDNIPTLISKAIQVPFVTPNMILEGGSIEVDGKGTLITTKSCLLNKNRNPNLSQTEIEEKLSHYLGAKRIFWLEDGIVGDDTDGHIDDMTRFANENTIITAVESNPEDANFHILRENLQQIKSWKTLEGSFYNVIQLPMPKPLYFKGVRLPASYANFLITNYAVFVPVFDDPSDLPACDILQKCFPKKQIKAIPCKEIVWGLGTLHCLSQQEPA